MIARGLIVAMVAGASLIVSSNGQAREALSRREIKSMPILERPSRPGHFYGNTVRRNAGRKVSSYTVPNNVVEDQD